MLLHCPHDNRMHKRGVNENVIAQTFLLLSGDDFQRFDKTKRNFQLLCVLLTNK